MNNHPVGLIITEENVPTNLEDQREGREDGGEARSQRALVYSDSGPDYSEWRVTRATPADRAQNVYPRVCWLDPITRQRQGGREGPLS